MSKKLRSVLLGGFVLVILGMALWLPGTDADEADVPIVRWTFEKGKFKGKSLPASVGKDALTFRGNPRWLSNPEALEYVDDDFRTFVKERIEPHDPLLPKKEFTVSAWVRIDEGTKYGGIVGAVQDNGDYERGWVLGYSETHFSFALATEVQVGQPKMTYLKGKTPFSRGRWAFVVGTFDGKQMRLFVNGQEDANSLAQNGSIAYPPVCSFEVGRYKDDDEDYPLRGAIREVSLYHRALSAEEIANLFKKQSQLTELPEAPRPNTFVIYPYLQYPTAESVTIMWESALAGNAVVEYGLTTADTKKVEKDEEGLIHEISLAGLTPETRYVYRVSTTTKAAQVLTSDWYQFMTAVKPDSAFSFSVIGDTQRNPKVTAKIAKLMYDRRPHFVIHCGDVVDNGPEKREWVQELFGPCRDLFSRCAVFPTIGNHEKNHAHYYKYFSLPAPEYYYSYRYGNADFFVVDTNKSVRPDSEQYKWLDKSLSQSTATWKFVYHHHPCWSSDDNDYGDTKKGIRRQGDLNARSLTSLYEKYKVDIVFNGHIHLYERTWPLTGDKVDRKNGVIYITSGGGGGSLEDFDPLPTWFKAQLRVDFHCCYVNIHRNKLEFKAFDQNGHLFDQFELEK